MVRFDSTPFTQSFVFTIYSDPSTLSSMDSLDDILNDQQVERRYRCSMPQHYVNEMAYSQPQYGISAINIDDMTAKKRVHIDSALGDFQFSPVKPTTFSIFDISCLDMYIQLDSQLTD